MDDVKFDTISKCFKKFGFVDNTAENLAKELFGTTVDELRMKLMQIMKKVMMTMMTTK